MATDKNIQHNEWKLIGECYMFHAVNTDTASVHVCFIVWSVLTYNSIVWNPSFIHLIDLLENLQPSFTKRTSHLSSRTYSENLAKLNFERFELSILRLIWADLYCHFKFPAILLRLIRVRSSCSIHIHTVCHNVNCSFTIELAVFYQSQL